jgi:HAE1 family hydrophobic/amphiphilic exporter-1
VRPDAAPTTDGEAIATVPLSSVAEIGVARMPPQIRRTDRKTTSRVSVQFDEQDVTTEEAQTIVRAKMTGFELPEGYDWDFGTWGQRQEEALTTMTQGVLLSLLIVLLLMAALFESFTQPLAILITLPLAFFGALWTLWLGGYELDAIGFIGIIILIGIVVNNGIVMVDHVNSLRRSGRERVEALLEGCGNRLRPVLMTAITTIFGLLPLALAGATVAGAYIDSLAIAVIGGLATSTFFTLIALPVWYTAVEDVGSVLLRLLPRRAARSRATSRLPKGGVLVDRV